MGLSPLPRRFSDRLPEFRLLLDDGEVAEPNFFEQRFT